MLARSHRLSRAVFERVLSEGKRLSSPHFRLRLHTEVVGVAVVVPKKVARLSVTRHRIKRRTFSALRSLRPRGGLIVYPSIEVKDLPYSEVEGELRHLLQKGSK